MESVVDLLFELQARHPDLSSEIEGRYGSRFWSYLNLSESTTVRERSKLGSCLDQSWQKNPERGIRVFIFETLR